MRPPNSSLSLLLPLALALLSPVAGSGGDQLKRDKKQAVGGAARLFGPAAAASPAAGLGVAGMSDFVGFSYSRASLSPPSPRFIHFLTENLNINADFLPTFGSFEASRAGVYFFTYSFLTDKNGAAIVALRVNGKTVSSAISSSDGHDPVSQSALYFLQPGDVVQLEVLQGRVFETSGAEFAYTSFSGWLVSSPDGGPFGGGGDRDDRRFHHRDGNRRRYDDRCLCDCCGSNSVHDNHHGGGYDDHHQRPRQPRPGYRPPLLPPPLRTTGRPHIYHTTTKRAAALPTYAVPSHGHPHRPAPIPAPRPTLPGASRGGITCCDTLLVSSGRRTTLNVQQEKFGVYRLDRVDPADGRAVFRHCENQVYIYHFASPETGWRGWLVGPTVGVGRGGIILESESQCVERDLDRPWRYYDGAGFVEDETVTVTCFVTDAGGASGRDSKDEVADHKHYHRHDHYYHGDNARHHAPRSLDHPGPGYQISSNTEYTEATFVFPNNRSASSSSYPDGGGGHHHHPALQTTLEHLAAAAGTTAYPAAAAVVVEAARNDLVSRDGFIVKRSGKQQEEGDEEG